MLEISSYVVCMRVKLIKSTFFFPLEIRQYRELQQRLGEELETKQTHIHKLQQSLETNEIEIEQLKEVKLKVIYLFRQRFLKFFLSLKCFVYFFCGACYKRDR